jgi:hypothetical protein
MGVQMMAPAGGVIFGIVLCAICCYALDRKFEECVAISTVLAVISVFGVFGSHNDVIDPATGVRGPEHQTLGRASHVAAIARHVVQRGFNPRLLS